MSEKIMLICNYGVDKKDSHHNIYFDMCQNNSNKQNGYCDMHQNIEYINNFDYFYVQQKKAFFRILNVLIEIYSTVHNKNNNENSISTNNLIFIDRIFDFILKNKGILYRNKSYANYIYDLLLRLDTEIETKNGLDNDHLIFNSNFYKQQLFNIPNTSYISDIDRMQSNLNNICNHGSYFINNVVDDNANVDVDVSVDVSEIIDDNIAPSEKEFIMCSNISNKKNGYCDKHQDIAYVSNNNYFYNMQKIYIVAIIKKLLIDVEKEHIKIEKCKIASNIFELLSKNKGFLYRNNKFSNVVRDKLVEFNNNRNNDPTLSTYFDVEKFKNDLFPDLNIDYHIMSEHYTKILAIYL